MKKILIVLSLIVASFGYSYSQDVPVENLPDTLLTKDQATQRIIVWRQKVADLESQFVKATQDNVQLKAQLDQAIASLKKCNDDYYRLIGANQADIDNFRQKLGLIEGRIREAQKLNDDQLADQVEMIKALENDLNALRGVKIAVLPEFFPRIIADAKLIKALYREKKTKGYVVGVWSQTRDCLWNIAGKSEIYGDPFQWPKIWQANTNLIKNPDIIHPGQQLVIAEKGPKTPEEMKAERKYWRQKRAKAAAAKAAQEKENIDVKAPAPAAAPAVDKKAEKKPTTPSSDKKVEKKPEPKGN